jgi:hypothetical protein
MFKKATRKQSKLKLALTGPSGSGKTMSALRLATGIVGPNGKIAVIDTENGSASLYANSFNFDVCEVHPPYTVEAYQKAVDAAETAAYDVIIIDSISHQWAGEGGLLELKEQMDARGNGGSKNGFANWGAITKKHEAFKSTLLHSPAHIITTMRSKQEYVLQDLNGKQVPKKVGLAPIQRDGLEYEMTVVFDIAMNHEAEASKDRTNLFNGKFFQVTEEIGRQLKEWLDSGEKVQTPAKRPEPQSTGVYPNPASIAKESRKVSEAQLKRLFAIQKNTAWTHEDIKFTLKERFNLESTKDLNMNQYEDIVKAIETTPPPINPDEPMPA